MPLACSSPVAARGVGLAHEERGSLPWLEARNQHTGGLSRRRLGGPLSGSSARPWLLVADILVGAPHVGRPSMMRSNCQMPGPRPEPAEAGADIAQAVVNWGLPGGGSERSAVAAAWMPHEKPGKGAAGPTSNRRAPRDMLRACARQMRCDGGAAIAAAEAAGAPTRGPVEGAPTQGTVEKEEEARPVRGGGGHRPKDRRGGGHRPEDRLDVDGSRRRFKLGFARGCLIVILHPRWRGSNRALAVNCRQLSYRQLSSPYGGGILDRVAALPRSTPVSPRLVQPELSAG